MKKGIFIFCIMLGLASLNTKIKAQTPSDDRKERLKSMHIAFITERLQLTPEEAQQFWPLYNEMWEKRDALVKQKREINRNYSQGLYQSDADYQKALETLIDIELKEAALKRTYNASFLKILSAEKVFALEKSNHDFKLMLIKKLSIEE